MRPCELAGGARLRRALHGERLESVSSRVERQPHARGGNRGAARAAGLHLALRRARVRRSGAQRGRRASTHLERWRGPRAAAQRAAAGAQRRAAAPRALHHGARSATWL